MAEAQSRYLKHLPSGRIYPYTDLLAERADVQPYNGPDPFAKKRKAATRPATSKSQPPRQTSRTKAAEQLQDMEKGEAQTLLREQYKALFGKEARRSMTMEEVEEAVNAELARRTGDEEDPTLTFGGQD